MISVVMATYNSSKYIIEQLDSIRNQSISVDEMVIIDDGSSDNTVSFLNEYISKYHLDHWKLVLHETNQGFINTFSDGLKRAQGDIIILCDHDDIWLENKVQLIKDEFDKNDKILCLATSFIQIDEEGNCQSIKQEKGKSNNNLIRRKLPQNEISKLTIKDITYYNVSPGCTYAISKELRDEYERNIETKYLPHDWKLSLIAACLDGLYYLDKKTTKYRVYSKNTIGLGHQTQYQKRLKILEHNVHEKDEMRIILGRYFSSETPEYQLINHTHQLFAERYLDFKEKKFIKMFFLFFKTIRHGKLYESIALDLITMIRG